MTRPAARPADGDEPHREPDVPGSGEVPGSGDGDAVPPSPWALATWLVLTVVAWTGFAASLLFGLWLVTWFWLGVVVVWAAAGVVVLVASTGLLVHLVRRRRYAATGVVVALLAGALVAVGSVDWDTAFARGWFALRRADFVAAERLARSGGLGAVDEWRYYGPELPDTLSGLSVDGHIARIGESGGEPVLFVAAFRGILGGAVGYAHFAGPPEPGVGRRLDGFGAPVTPRYPLGDGWWWVG